MKKTGLAILIAAFSVLIAQGQSEIDALRFSNLNPAGTARFVSTGGAFSALGGDFSTLGTNPAGIAVYRSNEFTITPSINFTRVNSSFSGTTLSDFENDFKLNNVGFIFSFKDPNALKESGWITFNLGFGYNNHNNYTSRRIFEGFNTSNSFMGAVLQRANQEGNFNTNEPQATLDNYTTGLAWDAWLLGLDTIQNRFFIDMPSNVMQSRVTTTKGSIRELNVSFGGNYSNRLYLGATLGFPIVRFEENSTFREEDSNGLNAEFNSMEFIESLITEGNGFNFKIGAIYRANDMIRLGAALHTPTFYNLEDTWRTRMKSDLQTFGRFDERSPRNMFDYELNTPLKITSGIGLVFGTAGLLSIDYEYADYTQMRLRSSDDMFLAENRRISDIFRPQHTIRAGGEIRLQPVVLRGGYSFHSNPYKEGFNNLERSTLSFGLGIRESSYFVDFAYYVTQFSDNLNPYFTVNRNMASVVTQDFNKSGLLMTVGFRF